MRTVATVAALATALQFAGYGVALAATHGASDPGYQHTASIPVSAVTSHYAKPKQMPLYSAPKTVWPQGGGTVALAGKGAAARAGSLPLSLAAVAPTGAGVHATSTAASAAAVTSSVASSASVDIEPQSVSSRLGLKGVVFTVGRADGVDASAKVKVSLSYAAFKDAYGGGWDTRLALVELPACALTTPQIASCRTETPLAFTNDGAAQTLTGTVAVPGDTAARSASTGHATSASVAASASPATVVAATGTTASDQGSGGGTFSATTLKPSGSWSAGGAADAFSWSYPITVPSVPGGLLPSLALSYDSQSVDGMTSNTNNQAGVVGDGWELTESYIERSYASCHQNPTGPTKTYDNCWSANNQLTLDLDGTTTTIIPTGSNNQYVALDDAGDRIQYETGASNGAQTGEYWVVTTSDGTQYYFGENELPGWASGDATTNSVDTEPVYATTSTQPCYNATFSKSYCEQAYRWNLDYVVDTHGDAVTYWYKTDTNYYAQGLGTTAPSTSAYTRDSYLSQIQYGQRSSSLYSASPAAEVNLTYNGRCSTAPQGCATSGLSSSTTSDWPDVPDDLLCASSASCSSQSPSFFTEEEMTGIETTVLDGSSQDPADTWALDYSFPAITGAGDTSTPSLWLASITHKGMDTTAEPSGGADLTLPSVTFTGAPMQNRVNLSDGYPWITRDRLTKITTETGEEITVNYSPATAVSGEPSSDSSNTTLAYPVYWFPTLTTDPTKDYFNTYIVDSVTEYDPTGGTGDDTITTTYTPVGNPAWHFDDDPLTPANQATWDQFRGYQGMIVSTGSGSDPVTKTQYTYFQGMDGDYLTSSSTRTVSVTDSRNDPAISDYNQYAGMAYETEVFNGSSVVSDTIDTPWTSSAAATETPTSPPTAGLPAQQAFIVGRAQEDVYTPLASGATRHTETQYTHDSYGRVVQTNDLGDVTQTSQARCTDTTYDDNTSAWILDAVAEESTFAGTCSSTPSYPADAISDDINYYDGATNDTTAPTVGSVTETLKATSYSSAGAPQHTMQTEATFDEYGRPLTAENADSDTTKTSYTPATGANPTSVTVTDPMGLVTTTLYDPVRQLPTQATDPAGYVTVEQYDALGRLVAEYKPGFPTSGEPNAKFTYTESATGPSVIDSYTLNDDGTYKLTETLYDSMLRAREVQTETPDGGRDITDTYYNTDGWESETTSPYYNGSAVSTTFVQAQVGDIPSATGYTYDGDGRKTAQIAYADGTQTWETTYTYGGNFVTTVPPGGGTAQTSVTNALGEQTDLIQYLAGEPTDYVTDPSTDYRDTKYTYYPSGKQATETDAAGNQWSWTYDLLGDALTSVDPDTGATTDTYDAAELLITSTDARGKQTTYVYDKDARKTAEYDTTSTSTLTSGASGNEIAEWVYDTLKKGYLTGSISYSNGDAITEATTGYNTLGLSEGTELTLTGTDAALVPSGGYKTEYGYTTTGLLASQSDPAMGGLPAESINYAYDEFGQPTELAGTTTSTQTYVSGIAYTEYDQVAEYTLPAGSGNVWISDSYDPQTQNLDSITTTDSTSTAPVDQLSYDYGNASGTVSKGSGLVTQVDDVQNAAGNTGTSTAETDEQCFTYDYADQLSMAWTATDQCAAIPTPGNAPTVGGPIAPYWESWTYDAAGDRLTETDYNTSGESGTPADNTVTDYNYPAADSSSDQPTTLTSTAATGPNASADTATYDYNPSGEEISATAGALGDETYTWNDQDQLQSTVTSAGTTNYAYDADGTQLIMRDPGSTTLTYGDAQIVDTDGTLSATRFYSIGGVNIAERTSAGAVGYLVPDRQGTDQLAISATAAQTVTRRQYLPFGGARDGDTTVATWIGGSKSYVGGLADATTGLETLGDREYDAITGRFISADPVFEADDPAQMAGYDYSGNDPVTTCDPSGDMRMFPVGGGGGGPIPSPSPAQTTSASTSSPHNQAVVMAAAELSSMEGCSADIEVMIPGASDQYKEEFGLRTPTGENGFADIVMKTPSAVYIWEVKQWASYPALQPGGIFTADGRPYAEFGGPSQLANYMRHYKEAGLNDGLPVEPGFPLDSPITAPLAGRPGYEITVGNSWNMLGDDDLGSSEGIITYSVTRIPKPAPEPVPEPVAEPAPTPWWETALKVTAVVGVVAGSIALAPETGGTSLGGIALAGAA